MPPNTQSERPQVPVTLDTPVTIKVNIDGRVERLSLPLRDLTFPTFPVKLRQHLKLKSGEDWRFERYSDSAGTFVYLDPTNPQVYKTLFRAAKAKLKLRIRATRDHRVAEAMARLTAMRLANTAQPSDVLPELNGVQYPITQAANVPEASAMDTLPTPTAIIPAAIADEKNATPSSATATPVVAPTTDADASTPSPERRIIGAWVIFCNECKLTVEDVFHYHCSICESGDYDLCLKCVNAGKHCLNDSHWLVKRFYKDGQFFSSITEQIGPKRKSHDEMPGAFLDDKQPAVVESDQSTQQAEEEPNRTCNCCVRVLPEDQFVTCTTCEDYDLCFYCHMQNKHGHHPGHVFKAALDDVKLPAVAAFLCKAGRNVRHSAICDRCNKFIYGVRHKCLSCPDWDFCDDCYKTAQRTHPRHRFVPIYEPLAESQAFGTRHVGIYCDGPLCKGRPDVSYIEGVRYKCAVCHDTDFCAKCEALPDNKHSHTHPLIKFKTPVRNVSMTTLVEGGKDGQTMAQFGDRPSNRPHCQPSVHTPPNAMKVQTVAHLHPAGPDHTKIPEKKSDIHTLLVDPVKEKAPDSQPTSAAATAPTCKETTSPERTPDASKLDAQFIRESVSDGTPISAGSVFVQTWTLKNPGPNSWPAGCCVQYTAGDSMLNLDHTRAVSQQEFSTARSTNPILRPVNPGEEATFRAILKAPSRLGASISYWRLNTPEGVPFGHRLWCDIQVVAPSIPPATLPSPWSQVAPPMFPLMGGYIPPSAVLSSDMAASMRSGQLAPMSTSDSQRMLRVMPDRTIREKLAGYELSDRDHPVEAPESRSEKHLDEPPKEKLIECDLNVPKAEKLVEVATAPEVSKPEASVTPAAVATEREDTQATSPKPVSPEAESSRMIFPKLEKESPASSVHEPGSAKIGEADVKARSSTSASSSADSSEEFFEDAESVDIQSATDGDSFLTDEEYDILDASDEDAE
ncbi:uncharacterized protein EI97DRAFT_443540 [Westerdykella ornata]|uniref:ZZ-type domain-containing protein n=1 Tax=Westerdykella ornata TaxID=318751 RepID=A0A6A6JFH5_WESOR|nr:uncharacterized protein EI97DRAFT_443540 [Westerdykella ornata]KAF2274964.1 hypothetical protein EI97DRAFT_443540 [Westerdykella ornata]